MIHVKAFGLWYLSALIFLTRDGLYVAHREAVTRDRIKFRERRIRARILRRCAASRQESFRAGECILANMTSFSGNGVLAAKVDTRSWRACARARLHRRLYFSPFYSAAILRALRSTVISVCTALFMTRTAAADCTTLAHAEEKEEKQKERKREKERESEKRRETVSLSLFNSGNKDVTSSA